MRARLTTAALVAVGALVTGALGIVLTLATSDAARWPAWLRPYHRWGWWAVLALLLLAAVLAVWQAATAQQSGDSYAGQRVSPSPTLLDRLHLGGQPGPLLANLPARNPGFTGRDDLLARLHDQLQGQPAAITPAQAVHGLGGVGKTQLALEYAHRYTAAYEVIWWIAAEQPATIPTQLVTLARRLGLPEQLEQADTVHALWDALRHRDRWLLIYDNAEDPTDLHPYWPPVAGQRGGRVLVTSRNPNWQPLAATIPVDVLPHADATAFLIHRVGITDHDAGRLAEALGDLPLALEQAAAYLTQTHTPPGEYLALLATRAQELFSLGRPATSEQTIATVWDVSLRRLRTDTPVAQDLLRLCAYLAPDDIPRTLLTEHPEALPARLAAAVGDRLAFHQALGALGRYSLLTVTGETLRVHRLIQVVTRHALGPAEREQWATAAVRLVLASFPEQADEHALDANAWPAAARLLAHALTVTGHPAPHAADPEATVNLLNRVSEYLCGQGGYQHAQKLCEQAMATAETRLGADHLSTADGLHNLAHVRHELGDLPAARALLERELAILQTRLAPNHPWTLHTLQNFGNVLHDQGDLVTARTVLERALALHATRPGPDDWETAASLARLGNVLAAQGDLDAARALLERALGIFEARLGPDHTATAWCRGCLGVVLHHLGLIEGARAHHERAVAIYEVQLGRSHPRTAESLAALARVVRDQGDLDAARALHERALAIRETRLGPDHPDTTRSREELAAVMAALRSHR